MNDLPLKMSISRSTNLGPSLTAAFNKGPREAVELGRPRFIYLDVLRALAILLVLGAHFPFRLPENTVAYSFFYAWRRMGWCGVDLFFVLSGFLVGGLLLSEHKKYGQIHYPRFLVRRAWKIWPAYLCFLFAAFAWDVKEGQGSFTQRLADTASRGWPYLIHIQNYYGPLVDRIGHAWSLAVEEHFYLLLPLALIAMTWWHRRRQTRLATSPFRLIPVLFGVVALACLGLRVFAWLHTKPFDEFTHHWPTHIRIDSLLAGVLLAYGVHHARPLLDSLRRQRPLIIAGSLLCFSPFCLPFVQYNSPLSFTLGYTLLALGAMGLVLLAWYASEPAVGVTPRRTPYPLPIRALAKLGTFSYSIYLWHMPFSGPLIHKLRDRMISRLDMWDSPLYYVLTFATYLAMAIGIGVAMYFLIEKPALALRERWFPSRVRAAVPRPPVLEESVAIPAFQHAAA